MIVEVKKARIALCCAAFAAVPVVAFAQFSKPDDAIHYRQSALTVMGAHFGQLGAVAKGEKPFVQAEVVNNATIVEMMSKLPWMAFGPGTDKGQTKAKPEVWSQPDKFKQAAQTLETATAALLVAAKSGDEAQFKKAFGDTGKACKGCHDDFRSK